MPFWTASSALTWKRSRSTALRRRRPPPPPLLVVAVAVVELAVVMVVVAVEAVALPTKWRRACFRKEG
jgi:hypothetical protein